MKKILLIFLLYGCLFGAIPGSSSGGNSAGDKTSASYVEPTLSTNGSVSSAKTNSKAKSSATKDEISGGAIDNQEQFFEQSAASNCSAEALKCPPLKAKYSGAGYVTMISYINPAEGKIGCTVYDPANDLFETRNGDNLGIPVVSQIVTRQACVKEFLPSNNIVQDKQTEQLRDQAKARTKQLENIVGSYSEVQAAGGKKYMDLGDWLDALATIDGEKIDIQGSLAKSEVTTTAKYTIKPSAGIFTNFEGDIRTLISSKNKALSNNEIDKITQLSHI